VPITAPVSTTLTINWSKVCTGATGATGANAVVFSLYAPKGTVFVNAHTRYFLTRDHGEAMITHEGFNLECRKFYVNELLRNHVLPASETHACLRRLIEVAEQSQ
jgi:hypothetical protein